MNSSASPLSFASAYAKQSPKFNFAGWPLAFRIITVAANREVRQYQERQGALIERGQIMAWLDGTVPEAALLVTPQAGLFHIEEFSDAAVQTALVL